MLDLARADAVSQSAKGTVGRGVAVAADNGGAGQGEALLRADHMNDALALIALMIILDVEVVRVRSERGDLQCGFRIVDALGTVRGRHVVVHHGERFFGARGLSGPPRANPRRPAGL